ncbi:hypothetical protein [Blastopirellula marina]|uniref:Uncharacterized protein n=1 Tax=Blastopirellula marina DSM 3645 TaxID=314230 RepID=A3ZMJ6_9BACT|nr:hypothetical protein [Blastopirellula marina]EAQ82169.1 hypothetical protein DSM3645_00605 [Blastopirellula marina DSM 3645]
MQRNSFHSPRWALAVLLFLLGCDSGDHGLSRAGVSGSVYVNGELLQTGQIAFKPANGTPGPSVGGDIVGGVFKIPQVDGPCLGTHRVEVRAMRATGRQSKEGSGSETPNQYVDEVRQFIPEKYNRRSDLIAEFTSSKVDGLKFELEVP